MKKKILSMLMKRQQEILDGAKAESRDMSDAEQRAFDTLQSSIDEIRAEIAEETPTPGGTPAEGGTRAADGDKGGENGGENGGGNVTPPAAPEGGAEGGERSFTAQTAAAILSMCDSFNMREAATDFITRGLSIDEARAAVMDKLIQRNRPLGSRITEGSGDDEKNFRAAVTDGIMLRQGMDVEKPTEGANRYRGMSLKEIGVECLERQGGGTDYRHMDTDTVFGELARRFADPMNTRDFYNPVAAFPSILDDVVKKSYVAGLDRAHVQFDKWVRRGSLPNFKKTTNHEYIASYGGELAEIPENGELPAYKPTDVKLPERQLKTYGRQFSMSRQAFIDDDIGLLTTMPARFAEMTLRTQNKQIYDVLISNPKQADGKTLFHASRKNTLAAGTEITKEAIDKMIYMLGMQIDAAGNQLALMPDLFIVPLGMGTDLWTLLSSPTINTTGNTQALNPFARMNFEIIEDVSLNLLAGEGNAIPWFMGVKNEIIQLDTLNGQREANIRRSEKPGVLGFVWDVYADWGVSVRHTETIIRNPGIQIATS